MVGRDPVLPWALEDLRRLPPGTPVCAPVEAPEVSALIHAVRAQPMGTDLTSWLVEHHLLDAVRAVLRTEWQTAVATLIGVRRAEAAGIHAAPQGLRSLADGAAGVVWATSDLPGGGEQFDDAIAVRIAALREQPGVADLLSATLRDAGSDLLADAVSASAAQVGAAGGPVAWVARHHPEEAAAQALHLAVAMSTSDLALDVGPVHAVLDAGWHAAGGGWRVTVERLSIGVHGILVEAEATFDSTPGARRQSGSALGTWRTIPAWEPGIVRITDDRGYAYLRSRIESATTDDPDGIYRTQVRQAFVPAVVDGAGVLRLFTSGYVILRQGPRGATEPTEFVTAPLELELDIP